MAISSERDYKPTEKGCFEPPAPPSVPLVPVADSPVGQGPSDGSRWRPTLPSPPLQHQLPDHGRHRCPPPAPAATSSTQLHPQEPRPAVTTKKKPVAGNNGTGAGLGFDRSQAPPASRSCAAAAVAKNQRPPLAGADGRPNLFEEFRYVPLAKRKAQDQAMAARNVQRLLHQGEENQKAPRAGPAASCLLNCCPAVRSTVAMKTSIKQHEQNKKQKQEEGSCCHSQTTSHCCATPASCPVGGCGVHSVGATAVRAKRKAESRSQVSTPLFCPANTKSTFNKFRYSPLRERKDQDHYATAAPQSWWPSSWPLSCYPPVGGPKVGRKRVQATSQEGRQQQCSDKRSKTARVSAAGKPKNKKSVSQQKPKKKSSAVLTAAEKRLDMYRRLPPDQLVTPRRTPYNLLQERYAPDPWKVVVICMLLNRTKGTMIKELVEGFFARYPDAQTVCNANLEGMVEYLRPTGLQLEKAVRIQKFSSSYLSSDWTYVTELHGVGKYAADAYAIFCAGRVMEVQPDDHKLVDYWKYVCNIGEPWEDEDSCFAI